MDDAEVRQLLEDAIARPDLTLQVEGLERHLHVLLVSESDAITDLTALGDLIAEEVSTFVSDIDELTIWSRCRRDESAHRHATVTLRETAALEEAAPQISPSVPELKARSEPEPPDPAPSTRALSDFCFVKNKMLLSAPLPPPHPEVTKAVLTFHAWERDAQLQVAPILEQFFRNPDPKWGDRVPSDRQPWMYGLATMRRDRLTSVAAWLSRYCSHPEEVMRELDRKLKRTSSPTPAERSPSDSQAETQADPVSNTSTHPQAIAQALNANLANHGLAVEAEVKDADIALTLKAKRAIEPKLAIALVYEALRHAHVPHLKTVTLTGRHRDRRKTWTKIFRLPTAVAGDTPVDRIGFDRPLLNAISFPVALVVGMVANVMLPFVMLPFHIWIHEFGHATVAWLSGYRALPLPFGWTSIAGQKQVLVYVGILFLLGLLMWQGWREKKRWPIAVGASLVVLQFYMMWFMSEWQFHLWVAFGGIGGEFYLSAFLMTCFYFRLPDRWRWDFWRFIVLVIAAATFCQAFWRWHLIDLGVADIPWGTIFGGAGDSGGDMNLLNGVYGWSSDRIINTYRRLGELCALTLIGVYGFFAIKMNPHAWFDLSQRARVWLHEQQRAGKPRAR